MSFHSNNFVAIKALGALHLLGEDVEIAANEFSRPVRDRKQQASGGNLSTPGRPLLQQIQHIRSLADGWDGIGSVAIQVQALEKAHRAISIVASLAPLERSPALVPCADGSVQIEWHLKDSSFEMYFEVDGSTNAWWRDRKSGLEHEAEGVDAMQLLSRWSVREEAWDSLAIAA